MVKKEWAKEIHIVEFKGFTHPYEVTREVDIYQWKKEWKERKKLSLRKKESRLKKFLEKPDGGLEIILDKPVSK